MCKSTGHTITNCPFEEDKLITGTKKNVIYEPPTLTLAALAARGGDAPSQAASSRRSVVSATLNQLCGYNASSSDEDVSGTSSHMSHTHSPDTVQMQKLQHTTANNSATSAVSYSPYSLDNLLTLTLLTGITFMSLAISPRYASFIFLLCLLACVSACTSSYL